VAARSEYEMSEARAGAVAGYLVKKMNLLRKKFDRKDTRNQNRLLRVLPGGKPDEKGCSRPDSRVENNGLSKFGRHIFLCISWQLNSSDFPLN